MTKLSLVNYKKIPNSSQLYSASQIDPVSPLVRDRVGR